MTEETAKLASKLLEQKSELLDDLSKICDKPTESKNLHDIMNDAYYYFVLGYGHSEGMINFRSGSSLNVDKYKHIKDKIKATLIEEINKEIERIDEKLKELKCE